MEKQGYVYIVTTAHNGTLYLGVTSQLSKRVWEHKHDLIIGFTKSYHVHNLVWFEQHATMDAAIVREKAIKEWKRAWKIDLIGKDNPKWRDLYPELI